MPHAASGPPPATHVGYLVSRFPSLTETFVLRELDAVAADGRVRVSLLSLFPPLDRTTQPGAAPWLPGLHRPGPAAVAGATLRLLRRRPTALAGILLRVLRDHGRDPRVLVKALVTATVAVAHAERVRDAGIEHLHAHFAAMPALAAWTVHRLTGIPYSVTPHAHDIFVHRLGLRRRLAAASFVVAISGFHRTVLARLGARPERLPLVPMGIDLGEHVYAPRERARDRPPTLLMVSSFRAYKGHRVLVEALADPRLRSVRAELVGAGPLEQEIRRRVREAGLEGRVRFAGPLPAAGVRARIAAADVLVQPSLIGPDGDTEGLPTTLVEGAACGIALVATRVAGVPDLVREGVTGMLAEPDDPRSLADALVRSLAQDDAELERTRRAAREHVEQHHDGRRAARALVDWFLAGTAIGAPGGPAPHA